MIDRASRFLGFAIVAAGAVIALAALAEGVISLSTLSALAVGVLLSSVRNRSVRRRERAFRSEVWDVRAVAPTERQARIDGIADPKLRARVAGVIARDGEETIDGDVARFPFPRGLNRIYVRRYWVCWGFAAVMLVIGCIPSVAWLQAVAIGMALLFGAGAYQSSREERAAESVIEVTPFRVSELQPDGSRRTILLNWALQLRDEPEKRRVLLVPVGADDGIALDYRRLGFDRLLELVVSYGGFRPEEPEPPVS